LGWDEEPKGWDEDPEDGCDGAEDVPAAGASDPLAGAGPLLEAAVAAFSPAPELGVWSVARAVPAAAAAAKARLFPGVAFRGSPRRPWVIGTGLDVWQLVELLQSHGSDLEALQESHPLVTERHRRLVRAYAERFPDDLERELAGHRRRVEELEERFPFLQVQPD
jgi:hypothetical protein